MNETNAGGSSILTINGGSSSIRFAVYKVTDESLQRGLFGTIDRIGLSGTNLTFSGLAALRGKAPAWYSRITNRRRIL